MTDSSNTFKDLIKNKIWVNTNCDQYYFDNTTAYVIKSTDTNFQPYSPKERATTASDWTTWGLYHIQNTILIVDNERFILRDFLPYYPRSEKTHYSVSINTIGLLIADKPDVDYLYFLEKGLAYKAED